jgi:2'-5' RNA ligase
LAERFDAAIFAPHVTLYAGPEIVGASPERILLEAARMYSLLVLRHEGIKHSDQFTKTVYVEFEETDEIIKLSEQLRQRHSYSSSYEFQPHLSLIYAPLVEAWKSACGAHPLSGRSAPRRLSARKN